MADYLPPRELWPKRVYTLPEFATYAERFNPTEELLGKAVAAGRGDRTAVLFEDQRLTYNQLLTQANKFANALRDLGVKEGDRLILRTPNIPPALVANFAILKLGAVCTRQQCAPWRSRGSARQLPDRQAHYRRRRRCCRGEGQGIPRIRRAVAVG